MFHISFSFGGLLTVAVWYLAISAVCAVAYGLYEALKNNLHTFYGGDSPKRWLVKAAIISLIQAPIFPIFALGLAKDKLFDLKQYRIQKRVAAEEEASQ